MVGRHLGFGTAIDDGNFLNPGNAKSSTGAVHGGVSAADNHDVPAKTDCGWVLAESGEERKGLPYPTSVTGQGNIVVHFTADGIKDV